MRNAASYVNQARRAAALSQRQLSERSGVPQSAIARIERAQQDPRVETLVRLLDACQFELRLGPKRGDDVDRTQIDESLRQDPAERLRRATGWGRFVNDLRGARKVG